MDNELYNELKKEIEEIKTRLSQLEEKLRSYNTVDYVYEIYEFAMPIIRNFINEYMKIINQKIEKDKDNLDKKV